MRISISCPQRRRCVHLGESDTRCCRSAHLANYKSEEHEQQRAKLAFALANSKKLQKRIDMLEKERETTEHQHEEQLRRVTALEREEAAAVHECQSQIRAMEDSLARANQDLKSMQTKNEDLGKNFAIQSGQLEAARKREVQAHESQVELARQLMDSIDEVKDEADQLDKVKGESAERGAQVRQLVQEIESLKEQKIADDKEIELKTVQLREAAAATRQAGQREETARTELGAKIQLLNSTIAGLNAKADRQVEHRKMERTIAAAQVAALENERGRLEIAAEETETKFNTLHAQYKQMQTALSLSTKEIQGLKKQREDVQAALATQLKEQEAERTKAERELGTVQKQIERDAAELEKQQKLAARDVRMVKDAETFHQNQMVASISDKIKQITALQKQVSQLQDQLELEKRARTEYESEVARLNEDMVSEAKEAADMKMKSEALKATIASSHESLKKCAAEKSRMQSKIDELKVQMQTQAESLQSQLDDERSRANESEKLRTEVETQLQTVSQDLLRVQRNLDDMNAQHNTTVSQIATLERRSQMQNLAAKTVSTLAQDRLANVTKSHALDAVKIETLKDDYRALHGMMEKTARELEQTQNELDSHQKQVQELIQQAADNKTANEKKISGLQTRLLAAQSNEKDMSAKVATLGQDVARLTNLHQQELLAARSAQSSHRGMKTVLARKQKELKEAREKITEQDTIQQQTQTDVQSYLHQLQSLGEEIQLEKTARKECEIQLAACKSAVITERGLSQILRAQLAETKTQLNVALTVQPVLDKTKRELESVSSELTETKRLMQEELTQAKNALANADSNIAELQASKTKLVAQLAADEEALVGSDVQASKQNGRIEELSNQVAEVETRLAQEKAARAADAKASAAARSEAKQQADLAAVQLQKEVEKLTEDLAAAKSELIDANTTISARDTELKVQAEQSAADAADAESSLQNATLDKQKVVAEYQKKNNELEGVTKSLQVKLNASEAEVATTKGLLQAETEAKETLQDATNDATEKLAQETKSHNETKDLYRSQLEDARLTIDRYAKEAVMHEAESAGLQDRLKDMERERMRIYGRLAETQMVLLSKDKALVESSTQAKRYRAMSALKLGMMKGTQARMKESASEDAERLQQQLAQAEAELEADKVKTERELVSC